MHYIIHTICMYFGYAKHASYIQTMVFMFHLITMYVFEHIVHHILVVGCLTLIV